MSHRIVLFAGPICSGKSTISKALAQKLGWRWVSFADYLRNVAAAERLSTSRSVLQDLGQQLINKGWLSFCRGVLDFGQWKPGLPFIIDGVRHTEAVDALQSLTAPSPVILIFVDTPLQTRRERFAVRDPESSFEAADSHPVEREAGTRLRSLANDVVDGAAPVFGVIDHLVRILTRD